MPALAATRSKHIRSAVCLLLSLAPLGRQLSLQLGQAVGEGTHLTPEGRPHVLQVGAQLLQPLLALAWQESAGGLERACLDAVLG